MNKKVFAAIAVAILVIICAISVLALVRCADATDPSDVDESAVSEPFDASEVEESLADVSDTSKDPAPETSTPAEESDVSEPSAETSKTPDVSDPPSNESSEPSETSKVEEPSQPDEPSEPEHIHTWAQATCTSPKTCKTCGETEGTTTAHDWKSATCLAPQTCKVCGTTTGSTGNHRYEDNTCTVCGDTREIICGDTPVDIVVNGKEQSVGSYEEALQALTLEDLENMASGEVVVLECNGVTLNFTAKGDGTFVDAGTGRSCNAQRVYNFYISQYCSHCGKRVGHGDNGTCTYFLHDTNCPYCGEFCKAQECHTCGE